MVLKLEEVAEQLFYCQVALANQSFLFFGKFDLMHTRIVSMGAIVVPVSQVQIIVLARYAVLIYCQFHLVSINHSVTAFGFFFFLLLFLLYLLHAQILLQELCWDSKTF